MYVFIDVVSCMAERKHKREGEVVAEFDEESGFILEPTQVEVGSGYTLSVKYDEKERPIIDVKTYGEVDIAKIRKEIERVYPNAQIRQLEQGQAITVVRKCKRRESSKGKSRQKI